MKFFTIEIELGNAAMESPYDVAKALEVITNDLRRNGFVGPGETGVVRDVNGNIVGKWGVIEA